MFTSLPVRVVAPKSPINNTFAGAIGATLHTLDGTCLTKKDCLWVDVLT